MKVRKVNVKAEGGKRILRWLNKRMFLQSFFQE